MRSVLAALVFAALCGTAGAEGRRHALLIAIGDYTRGVTDLEGPPHDVAALHELLLEEWDFEPGSIQVLRDGEATRAGILAAIDSLATRTRPGDFIFIYFSGHGTSSYELTDIGLDGNSGALVPADLDLDAPDLHGQLIVGSRDLRPRLEELDRDRQIFAAFDACYSGAAVRSLRAVGRPRYVALGRRSMSSVFADEEPVEFGSLTAKSEPYPYQNLLYVSAAARFEAARDVTTADIRSRRAATVDGRPHGAFTNSLLAGLSGAGDTNGDGVLSYGELYDFLRNEVSDRFPQQPQLLLPEHASEALRSAAVLGVDAVPRAAAPQVVERSPALRVKLENVPPELHDRLRGAAGVSLSDAPYDVLLALEQDGFRLYHGSGDVIVSYGPQAGAQAVDRILREVRVRQLIDMSFPGQDFNVRVTIPGNRGFLTEGESFAIEFAAERVAYLLLLNVDSGGHVSVLYPFEPEELSPRQHGSVGAPGELRVSPPFGTEYLKIFAFRQKPAGFESWREAGFSPLGPELDRLLEMLTTAPGSKAQSRLKVVTRETVR